MQSDWCFFSAGSVCCPQTDGNISSYSFRVAVMIKAYICLLIQSRNVVDISVPAVQVQGSLCVSVCVGVCWCVYVQQVVFSSLSVNNVVFV